MIKRLYIDNFRSLTNFEIQLDAANLLVGSNGSGKSTVFDALLKIQRLVVDGEKVEQIFQSRDLSTLQTSKEQRFELCVELESDIYDYSVAIEHDLNRGQMRIIEERLLHDSKPLFEFTNGTAQLYKDNYTKGPEYPFDWSQSGIGVLQKRAENQKLSRFREELSNWIIVRPCPPLYQSETRTEDEQLTQSLGNFAGWYRHASQENMGAVGNLFKDLSEVLPGFDSLNLAESGENARTLKAHFKTECGSRKVNKYTFDQLSDGQKALIALYSLLHFSGEQKTSLFIDEPDNYLSLREVSPWLTQLIDACGESIEQAAIISHHPITIDYLARAKGRWFSRDGESPTRVSNESRQHIDGLSTSEMIARGWDQ